MEFTDREADLLKRSLAEASVDPGRAAEVFYAHLFALMPETRDLFVADMTRQGDKLLATLTTVILHIDRLAAIESQIEELGLRHVAYGVRPEHYGPTGDALRAMFADILGSGYSDNHDAAWAKAYDAVSAIMISAIERRQSPDAMQD